MPQTLFTLPKPFVGAMQPVQITKGTKALREPTGKRQTLDKRTVKMSHSLLCVMVVVVLGTWEERQMVPAVVPHGVDDDQREPESGRSQVALHQVDADDRWNHVAYDVLHRVAVHGGPSERGRPLVVPFMDVPVEGLQM